MAHWSWMKIPTSARVLASSRYGVANWVRLAGTPWLNVYDTLPLTFAPVALMACSFCTPALKACDPVTYDTENRWVWRSFCCGSLYESRALYRKPVDCSRIEMSLTVTPGCLYPGKLVRTTPTPASKS